MNISLVLSCFLAAGISCKHIYFYCLDMIKSAECLSRCLPFLSANSSTSSSPSSISSFSTGIYLFHLKVTESVINHWKFDMLSCWVYSNGSSLLLRRECCTFSNGEYVKSGLALLEKWIADVTEEVIINFFSVWFLIFQNLICPLL